MGDWIAMSSEETNPMFEPENGKVPMENVVISDTRSSKWYCCPRTKCERLYSVILSCTVVSILLLLTVIIFLAIGIYVKNEVGHIFHLLIIFIT